MLRALAACVIVAMAAGCAEMSAGDCTDKGLCEWTDAETAPDGTQPASRIDAGLDATAAADTPADAAFDRTVAADGRADGADEAPDVGADAVEAAADAGDAATDAEDATADAEDATTDAEDATANASDASRDAGEDAADADDAGSSTCACLASAPAGWSGPIALAEATDASIPPCIAPYGTTALEGNADPSAPAAQCGCTCGAAADVQCPAPSVGLFSDSACSVACGSATVAPGGCAALSTGACGAAIYARARPPAPAGGSCPAQPTTSVPPMHWGRSALACALPAPATKGPCNAGLVCAPAPSAPFSGHLCVAIAGDQPCPSGSPYGVRHVYYTGATDGRGCTACTCSAPDGGSCSGSFTTYNATGCALQTSTFALSSGCDPVQIATASVTSIVSGPSGTGCAPSPVQGMGALVPTGATTVCCLP